MLHYVEAQPVVSCWARRSACLPWVRLRRARAVDDERETSLPASGPLELALGGTS